MLDNPVFVALMTGAAAGLVSWGAMRTEVKFLWRDLSRLEKRFSKMERRRGVPVYENQN